jgi:hypothetical protein
MTLSPLDPTIWKAKSNMDCMIFTEERSTPALTRLFQDCSKAPNLAAFDEHREPGKPPCLQVGMRNPYTCMNVSEIILRL